MVFTSIINCINDNKPLFKCHTTLTGMPHAVDHDQQAYPKKKKNEIQKVEAFF